MGEFTHDKCAGKVRAVQAFHMDSRGWADIAYSAVICPHGNVYEARWLKHRTAAQGTNDGNAYSYAICFLGGVDDPLTDAAKRAFKDCIRYFDEQGAGSEIKLHRDWHATTCPGPVITDWRHAGLPLDPAPTPTPEPPTPVPTPPTNGDPDLAAVDNLPHIVQDSPLRDDGVYRHYVRTIQALMFVHQAWPSDFDFKTTVDGVFGPQTRWFLAIFQNKVGLTDRGEQGYVGPLTWRHFYGL